MTAPHTLFDAAFTTLSGTLQIRAEAHEDLGFLTNLFVACSPLDGALPRAMIEQQASFQQHAYAASFPQATRRIVTRDGAPIGRIVIDWRPSESALVDIAVLPGERQTRAGRQMLHAWLEVVDRLGLPATLEVRFDNPARAIYLALGFEPVPDPNGWSPNVAMRRPARPPSATG